MNALKLQHNMLIIKIKVYSLSHTMDALKYTYKYMYARTCVCIYIYI